MAISQVDRKRQFNKLTKRSSVLRKALIILPLIGLNAISGIALFRGTRTGRRFPLVKRLSSRRRSVVGRVSQFLKRR